MTARAAATAPTARGVTFGARPMPRVEELTSEIGRPMFVADQSLASWVRHVFIRTGGTLENPEHAHLEHAQLGFLWTNVPNRAKQRWVVGTAELPEIQGGAWKRGRYEQQLRDWFGGSEPDLLITLYAPAIARYSDTDFCAILEHELYHCAQATTDIGAPRFHRDGSPIYAIKGHDVEEFVGVVRRYGARGDTRALVDAASRLPSVGEASILAACGTCGAKL